MRATIDVLGTGAFATFNFKGDSLYEAHFNPQLGWGYQVLFNLR